MTKKIKAPFEESEDNKGEIWKAIRHLRGLLETEKCLNVRKDEIFLLRYLRCTQYNAENAFRKIQTYYSLKRLYPRWYITDESIASFKSDLHNELYYVLEDRDRFGKRVYVSKLGMMDTSKTTISRQSQIQDLFLENVLDEEETQKSGVSVIVDLKNFPWTLLKWLTPVNICIAVKKVESLPIRKLEFHVVNTSVLLNTAIKLIWPFLSANTKENVHFHHENWQSLHKTIEPKYLPLCYGGTKSDINIEKSLHFILGNGNRERLSENLSLGYVQDTDSGLM